MSKLMDSIKEKAAKAYRHIVLPEGTEPRTVAAAEKIHKARIARVTLIGNPEKVQAACPEADLSGIEIIDPATSDKTPVYAALLYELRKNKGMTEEAAKTQALDPLYFGALMLKNGDADGMVAGAVNTTGAVLRPALQIIKTAPGIKSASSCFVMVLDENTPAAKLYGHNGTLVFGDCAVIPNPTSEQLCDIALASAKTAKALAGMDPKVAMLSFSTNGSAKDPLVDKVAEAVKMLKENHPELAVDGEMQADAALVEKVGAQKFPGSPIAGKANVLIFPDLQAGNIGYKLVQRLAGAEAIGPIIQGLAKPVNDLSRGCSVDDIISVVAIAAVNSIGA